MKGIANWIAEHGPKLMFSLIGNLIVYGLVLVFALTTIMVSLAIINFVSQDDTLRWVSAINALFVELRIYFS